MQRNAEPSIVVIVARAARPGRVKSRLLPFLSPEDAAAVHAAFLEDVVEQTRALRPVDAAVLCPAADVPLFEAWLPEEVQVVPEAGPDLAGTLHAAFRQFGAEGYSRIILRNSDSPDLLVGHVRVALEALGNHDLVFGPTEDGGYYLVGAREDHAGLFDPAALGTEQALVSLRTAAEIADLTTFAAPLWYDVDRADDLLRLHRDLQQSPATAPATARLLAALFGR